MLDDLHRLVVPEAFAGLLQHGGREVQGDAIASGTGKPDEPQQTAVAAAEVENAMDGFGELFEERGLAFRTVRDGVSPREVRERVLHGGPLAQRLYALRCSVLTVWVPSGSVPRT